MKNNVSKKVRALYKNHSALVLNDNGFLEEYPVLNIDSGYIETEFDILPLDQCYKYFNQSNDGITYLFNVDSPARLETSNWKELRRNNAINNLLKIGRAHV